MARHVPSPPSRPRAAPFSALAAADILRRVIAGAPCAPAPFTAFVVALNNAARRRIDVHTLGARTTSADEKAMLGLMQAATAGDAARTVRLAEWLARPHGRAPLIAAAAEAGELMLLSGYELPSPEPARPQRCAPRLRLAG